MSKLADANLFMRQGNLAQAAEIYEKLIIESGPIAEIARANLEIIKRKESVTPQPNRPALKNRQPESQHKRYISHLYQEVRESESKLENIDFDNTPPLVSIIVTAHNTGEYIESCLESLIGQSYPNKEIFIIDDVSTDDTPEIITRIAKSNRNIHYRRLNCNLGTYFAKNLGIRESKGEILFFQDSDDISHPKRIEILTRQLIKSEKSIIRGSYSRTDPDTDEVLSVNDLYKKLGLITLGVRRDVFSKIGYFNCTTKASDDEFFNRAIKFLGKSAITNNELPLYYNTYRDNSLFADMVTRKADGSIEQKPSESRAQYVDQFKKIHEASDIEAIRKRFRFPRIRDCVNVRPDMTKLSNPRSKVIINVCSIPKREQAFQRTINSVIDQCDLINVYLDGYKSTPKFLEKHSQKCIVTHSAQNSGLRDNGKFLALEPLIKAKTPAYYLTIDDDIIYPPDYTNSLIKAIDEYEKKCAIGVHGVLLKDDPLGYFSDRRVVYNFTKKLECNKTVNILGTGTLGFHTDAFKHFRLSDFSKSGMADLFFAILCKNNHIPLIAIARHEGWLIDMNPSPEDTLYHEFKNDDSEQSKIIKSHSPWGLRDITTTIEAHSESQTLSKKLRSNTIKLKGLTRTE